MTSNNISFISSKLWHNYFIIFKLIIILIIPFVFTGCIQNIYNLSAMAIESQLTNTKKSKNPSIINQNSNLSTIHIIRGKKFQGGGDWLDIRVNEKYLFAIGNNENISFTLPSIGYYKISVDDKDIFVPNLKNGTTYCIEIELLFLDMRVSFIEDLTYCQYLINQTEHYEILPNK